MDLIFGCIFSLNVFLIRYEYRYVNKVFFSKDKFNYRLIFREERFKMRFI